MNNNGEIPYEYNMYSGYNSGYNSNPQYDFTSSYPYATDQGPTDMTDLLRTTVVQRQPHLDPTTPQQKLPMLYSYQPHLEDSHIQLPLLPPVLISPALETPSPAPRSQPEANVTHNVTTPTGREKENVVPAQAPSQKANTSRSGPKSKSKPASKTAKPASKTAAKPPSKAKKEEKPKSKRNGGVGSRSGSGRRDGGNSDDEIAELDPKDIVGADLKAAEPEEKEDEDPDEEGETKSTRGILDEDKLYIVKYMADSTRYKTWRLKQTFHYIQIVAILNKKPNREYQVSQVKSFWLAVFEKYKAVRVRQEHTGGGDGDADSDAEETKSDLKRKRVTNTRRFSTAVLDAFEESEYFEVIDKVAHDDESVVRPEVFNSVTDNNDNDDNESEGPKPKRLKSSASQEFDSFDDALQDTMLAIRVKADATVKIEQDKLELMRQKEKREELSAKYDLALRLMAHENPLVQAQGERMFLQLNQDMMA
ncbi:hypothetical protein VKT23_010221 [Stygiomarasmius scandens]|uniref:No apical meristem-associated C-terminal domain-containing protein n=1 Tax=Marasmiellus scandens TaxID=2682957 RepID=A0ABR1JDC8_9AGAR